MKIRFEYRSGRETVEAETITITGQTIVSTDAMLAEPTMRLGVLCWKRVGGDFDGELIGYMEVGDAP